MIRGNQGSIIVVLKGHPLHLSGFISCAQQLHNGEAGVKIPVMLLPVSPIVCHSGWLSRSSPLLSVLHSVYLESRNTPSNCYRESCREHPVLLFRAWALGQWQSACLTCGGFFWIPSRARKISYFSKSP